MTLPGGGVWTYQYAPVSDPNSHIQSSDDPEKNSRRLTSITDDQGRRVEYSLSPNGVLYKALTNEVFDTSQQTPRLVSFQQSDYTFDKASPFYSSWYSHHWLTQIKHTWNWATLDNYGQTHWNARLLVQNDYTYDTSGQRLNNTITASDGTNRTEQYSYDELNRLKTVDYGDGQTQGYAFDAMGNRLSKTDSVTGSEGYAFNAANMMTSRAGNPYTNDADGNTLTGGGRTMAWDSQNRMVSCVNGANTSSFVYGADGIRKQSTVNGTTTDFVLDNSMFVRERNHANGASIATYLVGARGPEYRRDDVSGQVRWYLYDGLGSVLGEVDPNGNITSSRKYDVYGLVRGGNNPAGTSSHKFVGSLGHPSEDNTGLIYMRARCYDPVIGRFASEDRSLNGVNWYCYANNNPINYADADGRSATATFIIGFFLGFLASCIIFFSQSFSWHSLANIVYSSMLSGAMGVGVEIGLKTAFAASSGGMAAEIVNGISGGLLAGALFLVGSYIAMITVVCMLDVLEEVFVHKTEPVPNAPNFDWGFR